MNEQAGEEEGRGLVSRRYSCVTSPRDPVNGDILYHGTYVPDGGKREVRPPPPTKRVRV